MQPNLAYFSGQYHQHRSYVCTWTQPLKLNAAPCVDRDCIYVVTSENQLLALRRRDGFHLWKHNLLPLTSTNAPTSRPTYRYGTPVVAHGKLFISVSTLSTGNLLSFNVGNGKLNWSFVSNWDSRSRGAILSPPLVTDDLVICRTGGGVTAVSLSSGKEHWSTPGDTSATNLVMMSAQPACSNGVVVMPPTFGTASCYSVKTGRRLWSTNLDSITDTKGLGIRRRKLEVGSGPCFIAKQSVYTSDGHGTIYSLSLNDGKINWSSNDSYTTYLFMRNNRLYACGMTGISEVNVSVGKKLPVLAGTESARACIGIEPGVLTIGDRKKASPLKLIDLKTDSTLWSDKESSIVYGGSGDMKGFVIAGSFHTDSIESGGPLMAVRYYSQSSGLE